MFYPEYSILSGKSLQQPSYAKPLDTVILRLRPETRFFSPGRCDAKSPTQIVDMPRSLAYFSPFVLASPATISPAPNGATCSTNSGRRNFPVEIATLDIFPWLPPLK